MSGTAKFSAGSGMVSGSGPGGLGVRPAAAAGQGVAVGRPVCAADWPRHCAGCVGACPAVRGPASGRLDFPFAITAEMKGGSHLADRRVLRHAHPGALTGSAGSRDDAKP
jgi:hypothetical protein